ncbi:MAG: hypothetical protein ACREBU_25520 [Nitrososphaera sp.]
MNTKRTQFVSVILVALILVIISLLSTQSVIAKPPSVMLPTPAPTMTPGEPISIWESPSAPLTQPLATEKQVLEQALYYDAHWSTWDHPWSTDTLRLEPGRITIKAFSTRTTESTDAGRNEWFAPEIDADVGPVWRITIEGDVHVNVLSMNKDAATVKYDSVTYIISQRTGALLTIITGSPKK